MKLGVGFCLCLIGLTASAGCKGADLTDIQRNHSCKTEQKAHQVSSRQPHLLIKTVSPSLATDADAPLCLHRGRNSCGSRGSPQRVVGLALSRGLTSSDRTLLCTSSWSLLTASKEKVSPFSWREEKMANKAESYNAGG